MYFVCRCSWATDIIEEILLILKEFIVQSCKAEMLKSGPVIEISKLIWKKENMITNGMEKNI